MKKTIGGIYEYFNRLLSICCVLCCSVILAASCQSVKFGVSDLEKTGDIRAALALCYRAQKDNSASGGGNTRNCDSLQDEFVRWQRVEICKEILPEQKAHCLCSVYKICSVKNDRNDL